MRSNGWQNEFAIHQSNGRSITSEGKQAVPLQNQNQYAVSNWRSGQYNFDDGYMGMASLPYSYAQQQQLQGQQQSQQHVEPMYDEAGFADAFEEASQHAQEMFKNENETDLTMERDGSDLLHKDAIPMDHTDLTSSGASLMNSASPTQIRIGSDAIPYQEQKTRTPDQDSRDADDLARTAGQLLTSVQHDTSDKFQNSQFLALMRKIRDGEVRVEGEEFKETSGNDKMVSNLSDSVMHRAEKESNMLQPPPVSIMVVGGLHDAEVVRPTHAHDGQVLHYSNAKHREYVAQLYESAADLIYAGNFVIEYAPDSFTASDSSRQEGLEASAKVSVSEQCEAAIQALKKAARALNTRTPTGRIPIPLSMSSEPFESDDPGEQDRWLTEHLDEQNGLEDPNFTPSQARTPLQNDAHQLHPGGPFYPGQSPPLKQATMSGALGITADDLHHFDHLDESPGLSTRYQRPSVGEDGRGGPSASA